MKKKIAILLILGITAAIGGCSGASKELTLENVDEQAAFVRKDGSIQVAYVEDFNSPDYDLSELDTYIHGAMEDFNAVNGVDAVSLSAIGLENGRVKTVFTFKNDDTYEKFEIRADGSDIYTMDGSEALTKYSDVSFYSAKSESAEMQKGSEIINADKSFVIEANGPITLETYGKIKYYTAGKLRDSRHLVLSEGQNAVIIINK